MSSISNLARFCGPLLIATLCACNVQALSLNEVVQGGKPQVASTAQTTQATGQSSTVNSTAQPDWTKLFKSWENGCVNSKEFDTFEKEFTFLPPNGNGFKLGKVNLPPDLKAATGSPESKDMGDYTDFTLPLIAGFYYGIPVKAIGIYHGNENGIRGKFLQLNASVKTVKLALKNQKVSFKKKDGVQAAVGHNQKDLANIVCDFSN